MYIGSGIYVRDCNGCVATIHTVILDKQYKTGCVYFLWVWGCIWVNNIYIY